MNKDIEKLLSIALAEEGYLEKKSNKDLDDKTKNAGSKNYTKYWRDIYPNFQAQAWCDCFVKWCFVKAFGDKRAKELLCTNTFSYACSASANYFKKKNQFDKIPKIGSQIFFWNDKKTLYGHTGIVYGLDDKYVYTIEGNTSGGSAIISNGGGVCKKKYSINNARIAGYGHPIYSDDKIIVEDKKEPVMAYYPAYKGASSRIDVVFKEIGAPYGNVTIRRPVANANGYAQYSGTAEQNLSLIKKAKTGKLIKV